MSIDAPTRTTRARHRAGLVVLVERTLASEAQEKAVCAFASLATALLLDELLEPEVSLLEHLEDDGPVAAAGSR